MTRTLVVMILAGIATLSATRLCHSEGPPERVFLANIPLTNSNELLYLLIKNSSEPSDVSEFHVVLPRHVVSFVSTYGAGGRAVCEAAYLDRQRWFGTCDLYDVQFRNADQLHRSLPHCLDCFGVRRYFIAPRLVSCLPVFLGSRHSLRLTPRATEDIGINAALEISTWPGDDLQALKNALVMVGANGSPRLGTALIQYFGMRSSPAVKEEDLQPADRIPKELALRLDYQRTRGLGEWLEDVVATLP